MMIPTLLMIALAAAGVPVAPQQSTSATTESHEYATCLGTSAVGVYAVRKSIDAAVDAAFQDCASRRLAALVEITEHFKDTGMKPAEAAKEAADFLTEMDKKLAGQMREDIASLQVTGKLTANSPSKAPQ
jgi:hypothetical protein